MKHFFLICMAAIMFLSGCSDKKQSQLPGDSEVLVTVNGSVITRYDLDLSIKSLLGASGIQKLDEAGRKKVLESLVMSRAIAMASEKEAKAEELADLARKSEAYHEQLLVRKYLAKHAPPRPVTQEMVREHYETHPEEFGGKKERTYEMITCKRPLKSEERDALLKKMQNPGDKKDWNKWVQELQKDGFPLAYRRGVVVEGVLHPQLLKMMKSLKKGESSPLTFIKDLSYLVRIVDEKKKTTRPLKEVSGQIRKMLAPVQLKKAVEQVSQEVLQKAEVVYK